MWHPSTMSSETAIKLRRRVGLGLLVGSAVALGATTMVAPPAAASAVPTPDFLHVGSRLTWSAGDSTLRGTKLVPDPNGWLWHDDQWYRVESSGGSGGIGYEQLDILTTAEGAVVADVSYFLTTDPQLNINVASGSAVVVGNADALGEFWVSPAKLAALQEGFDGVTRIYRGPRQFNGETVEVVASATFSGGNYISYTYDLATGLLLVSGTMSASAGVLVTDPSGNLLDQASGSVTLSHRQFVGVRQVDVPWADSPLPDWLGPGWVGTYQGESRVEHDPSSGLPALAGQPVTVQQVVDRRVGNAVIGRELAQFGTTQGLPPTETTTDRAFGSAVFDGIWLPPESFTQMQPQQVLDLDPTTGRTVVFGGIQGGVAVVTSSGQADRLEQYYDVSSGLLTSSRYIRPTPGSGPNVTELALVSQG